MFQQTNLSKSEGDGALIPITLKNYSSDCFTGMVYSKLKNKQNNLMCVYESARGKTSVAMVMAHHYLKIFLDDPPL